jgi:hypothetical protein
MHDIVCCMHVQSLISIKPISYNIFNLVYDLYPGNNNVAA